MNSTKVLKNLAATDGRQTNIKLKDNLIGMDAVTFIKQSELDKELVIDALHYLMFLKRKRTGEIKARGCAKRRPQREYILKE